MLTSLAFVVVQMGAVHHMGEMRKVMRESDLTNHFTFANLTSKKSAYGLGPLDGLRGEVVVIDGKVFVTTVANGQPTLTEPANFDAPFFVWSTVPVWREVKTRDVRDLAGLEDVLDKLGKPATPFAFRVTAKAKVKYHIVDRPKDATKWDHDEIKRHFELSGPVELIGFWSDSHAGVFTHHDTHLHTHVLSSDRKTGGHVDAIEFDGDPKLYIPAVRP